MFYGWYVAASIFLTLLVTVGVPFYGMPFFYDHFIQEFGWTRAQTTSGIALATVLIQPLGGLLVHRFSPRKLIAFGAAMLLASLALFSMQTGSLLLYYAAWCVFMVGYLYAGPVPNQVILTHWFRRKRGLVIGLAYLGLGVGGAISQKFVALPLIERFGWRTALVLIGLSMLLLAPVLLWVIRDRPEARGLYADGDKAPAPDSVIPARTFGELIRRPAFWLLAFGSFCSIGAIGSINQHMKLLFQDARLSASAVADTTFWILTASLVGRVVMGWLADRISKKTVMVASYLFVAASIPLLFIVDRPGVAPAFALLFGFGLGADYMMIPLMAAQLFGPNSLARAMGIILPVGSIGQTCCPFLLGVLRDHQRNYNAGLAVVIAVALVGAVSIMFLPSLAASESELQSSSKPPRLAA
jgi:nitrate/nitrite transporter NarK